MLAARQAVPAIYAWSAMPKSAACSGLLSFDASPLIIHRLTHRGFTRIKRVLSCFGVNSGTITAWPVEARRGELLVSHNSHPATRRYDHPVDLNEAFLSLKPRIIAVGTSCAT
jgi:hypothetical protein